MPKRMIVWFPEDLRLANNPALAVAILANALAAFASLKEAA